MGLGALLLDLKPAGRGSSAWRRGASAVAPGSPQAAPSSPFEAAPGFIDRLAEARHAALFEPGQAWSRLPEGFRAEDVTGHQELEGFVSLEECAKRMEVSEDEVLTLARGAYLLCRWHRGRLLVRPGIL